MHSSAYKRRTRILHVLKLIVGMRNTNGHNTNSRSLLTLHHFACSYFSNERP